MTAVYDAGVVIADDLDDIRALAALVVPPVVVRGLV